MNVDGHELSLKTKRSTSLTFRLVKEHFLQKRGEDDIKINSLKMLRMHQRDHNNQYYCFILKEIIQKYL